MPIPVLHTDFNRGQDDGIGVNTVAHEHVPDEPPLEIVPFSETEFTEGEARAPGYEL